MKIYLVIRNDEREEIDMDTSSEIIAAYSSKDEAEMVIDILEEEHQDDIGILGFELKEIWLYQ